MAVNTINRALVLMHMSHIHYINKTLYKIPHASLSYFNANIMSMLVSVNHVVGPGYMEQMDTL